jgi:hypothetical protein
MTANSSPKNTPKSQQATPPTASEPAFGWTQYAEILNGRFAMVGVVALLITEFFSRQDFFTWLGLR